MDELFSDIRNASSPKAWSQGVELSRGQSVFAEEASDEELVLRVVVPGRAVAQRVLLWPKDGDWNCDCNGSEDPCSHIAAAIIAVRRANEQGTALPPRTEESGGTIGYRLTRSGTSIKFDRSIRDSSGHESPLVGSLVAQAANSAPGRTRLLPTKEDLELDVALGTEKAGIFPRKKWHVITRALAHCKDVTLDEQPIVVSADLTGLVVKIEDEGPGIRLSGMRDPEITEMFGNGLALCGSTLKAVTDYGLSESEHSRLVRGERIGFRELPDFCASELPDLRRRIPVVITGRNLPEEIEDKPRLVVETSPSGTNLDVVLAVVYGDPPVGRVVHGQYFSVDSSRVAARNLAIEQRLIDQAKRDLGLNQSQAAFAGEGAVKFVDRLRSWRGDVTGSGIDQFTRFPELQPKLRLEGKDPEIDFATQSKIQLQPNEKLASSESVLGAWQRGESLVPLLGGGWAPLPTAWLSRYGTLLADLLAAKGAEGRLPPSAKVQVAQLAADMQVPVPPSLEPFRLLLSQSTITDQTERPSLADRFLRDYQRHGVGWISALRAAGVGGILADDMGLGKTLQTIAAVRGRTLIVALTSVLQNWVREIQRFRPDLRPCLYHGKDRKISSDADMVVTSYAILRLDEALLTAESWDAIVLDEAQTIKNSSSQVTQITYRLRSPLRLCLTGTPIENRPEELWSQFNFCNPGLLGSERYFSETYGQKIQRGDADALTQLRQRIQPFILRRKKSEVAQELPPKTTVIRYAELSSEERAIYDALLISTRTEVLATLAAGGGVIQALELLLRLRQASCHGSLVPGQSIQSSAKIQELLDILEGSRGSGQKRLVFSQWTGFLDKIAGALAEAKFPTLRIDGSVANRQEIVDQFQNNSGDVTLLISLKAGGTGLNLTAADQVIIMDPWWNPFAEDQAADRAHRIGQTKPVLVQKIVAKNTVEEKILELQETKRQLAESVLTGDATSGQITRDELISILQEA